MSCLSASMLLNAFSMTRPETPDFARKPETTTFTLSFALCRDAVSSAFTAISPETSVTCFAAPLVPALSSARCCARSLRRSPRTGGAQGPRFVRDRLDERAATLEEERLGVAGLEEGLRVGCELEVRAIGRDIRALSLEEERDGVRALLERLHHLHRRIHRRNGGGDRALHVDVERGGELFALGHVLHGEGRLEHVKLGRSLDLLDHALVRAAADRLVEERVVRREELDRFVRSSRRWREGSSAPPRPVGRRSLQRPDCTPRRPRGAGGISRCLTLSDSSQGVPSAELEKAS